MQKTQNSKDKKITDEAKLPVSKSNRKERKKLSEKSQETTNYPFMSWKK